MTEIKTDYFDPKSIALSGQCFRWRETEDGGFRVPAFGKLLTIHKVGDRTFEMGCDSREFDEIWRDYLDISGDYGRAAKAVLSSDDDYLKGAFKIGEGVRILRQDLWETVVSFLISQNNNIPRIKKSIEALCNEFGEEIEDGIFSFPSAERLAENSTLLSDKRFGLGYRDAYIREISEYVCEDPGWLEALKNMDRDEAYAELIKRTGIGPKVANCICLFGLHHIDAFPVDTHVRQILDAHYPEGFDFERYKGFAGVVQQYMFFAKQQGYDGR
ncbi:MAG: 8-oxoguanine DNA glycosylase [Lachnospiraceae bacterium]|nr:8-oxoguanine DNA glycosylase [Lachnospiraceae bacterium]